MMQISFPYLGIEMTVDRVAFTIFQTPVYWYGIIIALGFVLGIVLASFASLKLGEKYDVPIDLALVCTPLAIICARLYYVIFRWDMYKDNLISVFDIRSGGIAIYGAIIGAVISALVYCRITKKNTLKMFDIGSVGLITGQMIGRWGNFVNQEAFGTNTTLPWAMKGTGIKEELEFMAQNGIDVNTELGVHPTFLYESLWSLLTLCILFVIIYKKYKYTGQVFFAYCSLYGLGRLWIEGLRTDSLMIGPFRVSQLLAFVCFLVFSFLYFYFSKRKSVKPNC